MVHSAARARRYTVFAFGFGIGRGVESFIEVGHC